MQWIPAAIIIVPINEGTGRVAVIQLYITKNNCSLITAEAELISRDILTHTSRACGCCMTPSFFRDRLKFFQVNRSIVDRFLIRSFFGFANAAKATVRQDWRHNRYNTHSTKTPYNLHHVHALTNVPQSAASERTCRNQVPTNFPNSGSITLHA